MHKPLKAGRKKYVNYQIQDFLTDESFIDWVCSNKDETHQWFLRFRNNPELQFPAEQAEKIIQKLHVNSFKEDHSRLEILKNNLDKRLDILGVKDKFGNQADPGKTGKMNFKLSAVAAGIALLIASFFVFQFLNKQNVDQVADINENLTEIRSTKNGNKLTVHFSDGSKVKLNSGSRITYEKYFSDSERVIFLEGEAFFEVAKDSLRPFRVHASNTITQALGTSFNVRSLTDSVTRISLATGNVKVLNVNAEEVKYLVPGEMIVSNVNGLGSIKSFDYSDIAWKDDVLAFKNVSSEYVFETLEKWYGVSFEFENGLRSSWNYTGEFNNQSLHDVLTSIGHAEDFEFSIQNKKVVIKPINKK